MANAFRRTGDWLYQRPYLLLSFSSLFWAINVVVGRFVVDHVPPVALSYLRWGGAFLLVLPFVWPHLRRDWPIIRANLGMMTLLAVTGISAYNTMAYWGLQYTQAINALLIQSTAPLMVALWTFALFGDRLTLAQTIGTGTSLAGVTVILCRGDLAVLLSISFNRGDVWIVGALMVFAVYAALTRKRPPIHPLSFLCFSMGWGTLWLTPFYLWEISTDYTMTLDVVTLATLAYVIVFPSILAYFCFNRGVELVGPNRAAPFFHLIPVFGSALAIVFLDERPRLFHVAGYALVLAGVVVATRRHGGAAVAPGR